MKTFKPFNDQVEIKPILQNTVINTDDNFVEAGEVISEHQFIKKGDIVFFDSYGCFKTTDQVDGVEHYVVKVSPEIIHGIYGE